MLLAGILLTAAMTQALANPQINRRLALQAVTLGGAAIRDAAARGRGRLSDIDDPVLAQVGLSPSDNSVERGRRDLGIEPDTIQRAFSGAA